MALDLSTLNDAQRAAVTHDTGPLLVVAGAGSGKTRVLTHRIAHLVDAGVAPYRILALTFTNKSAEEMRLRAARLLGGELGGLWAMTFHAACLRLLRPHVTRLGYPAQITVLDADDQRRVMRAAIKAGGIEHITEREALEAVGLAKNRLRTPTDCAESAADERDALLAALYRSYQQRLVRNGSMDFDDLLVSAVALAENDQEVREEWQRRFTHVLVDEYQDTNHAQYRFLRAIAAPENNLCAVGDPNQSIYSFRGADISNIEDFTRDFPAATVVALEENYRSHQLILDCANELIAHNAQEHGVRLRSQRPPGPAPRLVVCDNQWDEAREVARWVARCRDIGIEADEIAVLFRTNAQGRALEETLRAAGVAYRVVGGPSFYDRAEIRDALAYVRLALNPRDALALTRATGVPRRGIGPKALQALAVSAGGGTLHDALRAAQDLPGVAAPARTALTELGALLDRVQPVLSTAGAAGTVLDQLINESGLLAHYAAERTLEAAGRVENLRDLIDGADRSGASLAEWMEQVALLTTPDEAAPGPQVSLMTLHAAKGLEFDHVAMVGLEEGLLPYARGELTPAETAEERRLCYVGVTRARRELVLFAAAARSHFGGEERRAHPSRFLAEMKLIDRPRDRNAQPPRHRGRATPRQGASARREPPIVTATRPTHAIAPSADVVYQAGMAVVHESFGAGMVVGVTGDQVRVLFGDGTARTLLASLAPMQPR